MASSKIYNNNNSVQMVGPISAPSVGRHHSFQLSADLNAPSAASSSILAHNNHQIGGGGGGFSSGSGKTVGGTTTNYMSTNAGKRRPSSQALNKPSSNYGLLSSFESNPELCSKDDNGGGTFGRMSIQPVAELQQVVGGGSTTATNQSEAVNITQNGANNGTQILCKVCGDKAR